MLHINEFEFWPHFNGTRVDCVVADADDSDGCGNARQNDNVCISCPWEANCLRVACIRRTFPADNIQGGPKI